MIYHIYWGTAGNSGLYLEEIYQVLRKKGYSQKVFVNYYYPFNYGEKVFFKRTEMEHCKYHGFLRKVMMGIELFQGLTKVLFSSIKDKPSLINFSYAGWSNSLVYVFLYLLRKINRGKLVITCHDVIPSLRNVRGYDKELKRKERIYSLASYYLVHNNNSIDDLIRVFVIDKQKVLIHPFPLMDLSKLDMNIQVIPEYDYLFIGHLRKEKGVDLLLDAWQDFHALFPKASLCIAGNAAYYKDYLFRKEADCKENNVTLKLGFVEDKDYIQIIKSAKCVLFPYTSGTNSGVISTVISLRRNVITSDIGMFANNPLVPRGNMFKSGDKSSFVDLLIKNYKEAFTYDYENLIGDYRNQFTKRVNDVYSSLLL